VTVTLPDEKPAARRGAREQGSKTNRGPPPTRPERNVDCPDGVRTRKNEGHKKS